MNDNLTTFQILREKHSVFTYESFNYKTIDNIIEISFDFRVGEKYKFQPVMQLSLGKYTFKNIEKELLEGIIFHIGLIELISYWKAFCSPTVLIKPYYLNNEQQNWWKKLYWRGLGEFFYQNKINPDYQNFLTFQFKDNIVSSTSLPYPKVLASERVIVPIGGGKDSVVTLEALRKEKKIIPFIINPREATLSCASQAGFKELSEIVVLQREISPLLLQLNQKGFLNGHTPFSAMLAFYTLLVAYTTDTRHIALSNESSANEPTIPNSDINHQYSKSLEFEKDFQEYVQKYMNDVAYYYSFLRPYNELQIAEMFSHYTQYHAIFRSCNVGSKENKWCCNCSKCLFAYIILSPFLSDAKMIEIFGEDLLDKPELQTYFNELTGIAENKPFECVGTIEEVNKAIALIADSRRKKWLIKHYNFKKARLSDSNNF